MRWPSVRGAARVLALAAGLLALALPLTIMAGQGGASPYQWTTSVAGSSQLHGVVWDGTQFVAFGDGGAVYTSPDGQKWTAAQSGTDKALQAAAWSGKSLVAVGSEGLLLQSPDAKAWSVKAHGLPAAATAVAYGQIKAEKGLFVAVGPQGLIFTSHDGSIWKHRVSGTTQNLNAVTYGDGLFVAVGDAGAILPSADGKQWAPASGASVSLQGVAFGNGLYVAVGQNGAIYTSADARAWSAAQAPQGESLTAVTYTGMGFVAVGQGGAILRSADGQSWAAEQSPLSTWLHGVTYGQGHVVAVGDGGIVVLAGTPLYIGGTVTITNASGQPIYGVTVTATVGTTNYSAPTNATGTYQISNLPDNTTYALTASGGGGSWTFTPTQPSVTLSGSSVGNANFYLNNPTSITTKVINNTTSALTPTIIATGGGGNTFTYTPTSPILAPSGSNATYTNLLKVAPGTYTITASGDHAMFTPASIPSVDCTSSPVNLSGTPFTAVAAYLQAGHVFIGTCPAGGSTPIQGVTVTATDGTNTYTTVSDSAGAFQFFLATGTWTLHFVKGGTMFCPNSGTPNYYTLTVGSVDLNTYAWYGQGSYSISGTVTIAAEVAPLKNAMMTIAGTGGTPDPSPNTVTTNTNGYYIFNYLPVGTYTVTPSYSPALIFSPANSGTLTVNSSLTGVNFDAATPMFTGTVTDSATALVISGVTITADDGSGHVFTAATNAGGTYELPVVPGTYTLTPTAPPGTTYTFNPASLTKPIDAGTLAGQDFAATGIFPVSGYVYVGPATTAGIPGVTITATINSVLYDTQTTDANGHFSFNLPEGLANQATFNLSKAGFTFTPNPFTYTVTSAYSGLLFYGTESYSVTGTVMLGSAGLQNVKVTLTPGGLNALTDSSGNFTIPNVPVSPTPYTATPALAGYTFSPVSSPVTVPAGGPAPAPLAFTATQVFTIKGTVTATVGTDKFIVTATSGANTYSSPAVLGSGGAYTISGVPAGTYTLTIATAPTTTNTYVYNPASLPGLTVAGNLTGYNFTATQTFAVSGYVKNGATGIPGVTITATISSVLYDTQTTDGNGHFSFNLPQGSQAVFNLSKSNFTFTPNPYTYPNPLAASDATLLFSGTEFYSITGTVTVQPGGGVLSGATITVAPGPYTATTDSSGNFTVANVPVSPTPYTVTPSLANYIFSPVSSPVTVPAGGPAPAPLAFTATPLLTISGTVSGATVATDKFTVTATLGSKTYTSLAVSGTGVTYNILKVPASATPYTLTIAMTAGTNTYLFNPASQPVTLTSAPATGYNFTVAQTFAYSGFIYKKLGTTYTSTPIGVAIPITVTSASGSPFGPFAATADATTGAFTVNLPSGTWTWAMTLSGWNFVDGVGNPLPEPIAMSGPQPSPYHFYGVQLLRISGSVTDGSGNGVSGVTITAQGSTQSYTVKTGSSGSYTTPLLPADVYTVYATLTGYQFDGPFSVNLTKGANVTGIKFTATALSSISGTVLDSNKNPMVGLTVSAGGGYTATTASDGTYTIPSVPTGTYTVTPGPKAGYVFSPPSQSVTLTSTTPYTGVDFTGTAIFNIKGTVTLSGTSTGLSGVLVSAGGSYTATTASNGTYTIPGVPAGSYTVTPSLAGYGFSPTSYGVTVSTADVTQNFTAFKAHNISGKVTAGTSGVGGVTISAGGGLTATTANDGTYAIPFVPDSATPYTVTASLVGYTFSPASQPATVNGADATGINFTATQVFNIKGTVADSSLKGVAGVSVSAGTGLTATTAADGTYTIAKVPVSATPYTVTPTKTGYTFNPATRSVTVSSADVTLVNFTATAVYTISGTVKDGSGNPVKGVTVSAGTGLTATTAADGTYTIANVPAGTYALAPSLSVYSFTPATLSETVSTSNITGANFTITYFTVTASSDKTSGNEPLTVSFSSAVAGGLGPYTFDWSFGDGTSDGTTASISHTFTQTGLYTVQLTVTDANNNSVAANAISIQVGQPTLAVTATSSKTGGGPAAPMTVAFAATATGGSGSYTYAWTFGDGGSGTGASPSHTYTSGGTFSATVTVTDSQSHTASASVSITVLPPPVISAVTKMTNPFRLKIMGSNFHLGAIVKINGAVVPFSDLKSSALIVAKKGPSLSTMVPKGVPVQITVTNTDDGGVSTAYSFVR